MSIPLSSKRFLSSLPVFPPATVMLSKLGLERTQASSCSRTVQIIEQGERDNTQAVAEDVKDPKEAG